MFEFNPPEEKTGYTITVLVDDPDAWIVPWAEELVKFIRPFHKAILVHDADSITEGDFCFLLGCTKIVSSNILAHNPYNLVVHESDLPKGRGFSPVAWQVLSGKNTIPVCLFEAVVELDSGPIYLRDTIELYGTELMPEIRYKQGDKTVELCLRFLLMWPDVEVHEQQSDPDSYRKRNRRDDRLYAEKSIAQQFDHLRIVDNERYPAWFEYRGQRYILKIFPDEIS